jgi:hypothetical protein
MTASETQKHACPVFLKKVPNKPPPDKYMLKKLVTLRAVSLPEYCDNAPINVYIA